MKITVFGTGYVGLVQAACLADVGHKVVCVDIDKSKVAQLQGGAIPIYEPGLEPLVASNVKAGRLSFTCDAAEGVEHGEVIFIAVGTPPDESGAADLQHVLAVANTVGQLMKVSKVVVNKSTVPVGTAAKVSEQLQLALEARELDLHFAVVSNPEFLKEGAAVADCSKPDRIVIGCDDSKAIEVMCELYEPFNRNHQRVIVMDAPSAELTKYAANCMLATKISFINEMANIAEQLGADIEMVRKGIGADPRIGYHFIYPGCGYGGSCFPKDVSALISTAEEIGYSPQMLHAVEAVNARQKQRLFEKLSDAFDGQLAGRTVAVWGLSFKPETDDMREAPSRTLIEQLWQAGAKVQAYDPVAMEEAHRIYGDRDDFLLMGTKEMALKQADALVICTEWKAFRAPDFNQLKGLLSRPLVIDGRNLYDPQRMAAMGFEYQSMGR